MKGEQDQDSITVFVGTWNMGERGGGVSGRGGGGVSKGGGEGEWGRGE